MEMTIHDEDYSDILGCKPNEKLNRIISDQSSWVATVMAAQINRPKPDTFLGFPIFACLETDAGAPEHDEADVIVPQTGTAEWGQGTLSRSGKEDKELGKRLEIEEGVGPGKGGSGQGGPSEGKDGSGQGGGGDGKDGSGVGGPAKGKDGSGEGGPAGENDGLGERGPGAVEAQPAGEATGDVSREPEEKANDGGEPTSRKQPVILL